MWLYFLLTAVTISLAWCIREEKATENLYETSEPYVFTFVGYSRQKVLNLLSMMSIFIMLFVVSALRLNVGNDYAKYVNFMHLAYANAYVPTEVGFNDLTKIVYYLSGYENYLLVFACFSFATVLLFLLAIKDLSDSFRWSFLMFMLLTYYFQSLSTVRYYLVLAVAMFALRYLRNEDWPRFVLTVLLGALFHKSILVILVLYPLCRMKWRRWMGIVAGCLALTFIFLQDLYLKLLLIVYPSYEGTEYLSGGTSLISIGRCIAVLAFAFFFREEVLKKRMNRFYIKCNILALCLYVFCSFIPVISRIGYYLTLTQILLVPAVLVCIKDSQRKRLFKIAVLAACAGYFAVFMLRQAAADGVRILPYETFLFHDMVPLEYEILD